MEGTLPEGLRGQLLALALTVTVLVGLWIGCVQPLMDWQAARTEALARRTEYLRHMTATAALLPELQRQLPDQQTAVDEWVAGDSDAVAGATLQTMVQDMATAAGAELSSMEVLPVEPRGAYRRLGLRVETAAPWQVLIELQRAIAQATPRMLIDDLRLRAPTGASRTASEPVSATFTVVAFREAATRGGE
jgi:general secretion pathway protein M